MKVDKGLLEIKAIDKHYGGVHALDHVSFRIMGGEIHAIVGENGAGKSTLMKILAGTIQPDSGDLLLNGEIVSFNSTRESHAAGINIIYQEFYTLPALDVVANVFTGREMLKYGMLDEDEMRRRAYEVFKRIGVDIDLDARVGRLSVANQQVIEIAKALVYQGNVLIMDEPNSALTDRETQALFNIIRKLKEHGMTVLYVSHRLEEVFQISDRITVLRDGKYIGTWKTAESRMAFIISQMIGRTLAEAFPKINPISERAPITLEVRGLKKNGLLDNVSFSVRKGEVVGFAGLEGSGIRDLFHMLFGLQHADQGEIWYCGTKQNITFSRKAIKAGWGLIPANRRDHGLLMRWSINDNIALVILDKLLNLFGLIVDHRVNKTSIQYINKLNIVTDTPDKIVFQLSGGNQQKVVLAKWLATNPKLLILDDPTRGIDVGAKSEIYILINELSKQGISILFSSSEIDEVIGLSHRILVTRQGRIIKEYSYKEVNKAELMRYVSGDINHKNKRLTNVEVLNG